jgi:hypothetical protein
VYIESEKKKRPLIGEGSSLYVILVVRFLSGLFLKKLKPWTTWEGPPCQADPELAEGKEPQQPSALAVIQGSLAIAWDDMGYPRPGSDIKERNHLLS